MKLKNVLFSFLSLVLIVAVSTTAFAQPRRWRGRRTPVVVAPGPKVVVTHKPSVVTVSEHWGSESVSQEKLTAEEIKKRKIKPEFGLIDFEIYPYNTKVYLDGDYKGYARTLNKTKYSVKARQGKHVIELEKQYAPRKVITIEVVAGEKTIVKQD
jgi:hypothetical protein